MSHTRKSPETAANRAKRMHRKGATRFPVCCEKHSIDSYHLPDGWRSRLPAGLLYYKKCIEDLKKPNSDGWMVGRCPFHDDKKASFSAHQVHGGWRCFAGCGHGDLISFHCRLTGQKFVEAVRDLIGEVDHG